MPNRILDKRKCLCVNAHNSGVDCDDMTALTPYHNSYLLSKAYYFIQAFGVLIIIQSLQENMQNMKELEWNLINPEIMESVRMSDV